MNQQYSCKIVETSIRELYTLKGQYRPINATSPERAAIKSLTKSRSIKLAAWHQGGGIYVVTKSVNLYEDEVLGKVAVHRAQ